MGLSWCKVASNLDSHPKIRRAGRNGREVFLFALRRNAEPGNAIDGRLPIDQLEPWYLADQLQMPESEAVTGVTRAMEAGLLALDGLSYVIVGWEAEWSKELEDRRDGNRARQAKYREERDERLRNPVTNRDTALPSVTNESVTPNVPRRDEKRLDETRGEEKRVPRAPRRKASEVALPADWKPTREHGELAIERGVDLAIEARRFKAHADTHDRRAVRWNGAFTAWLLKADPPRGRSTKSGLQHLLDIANGVTP